MATAAKLTDDLLRCNICMEVFKNPSSLPCQHTYCRECLSNYIKSRPDAIRKRSVPCPSCRGKAAVPNPSRPVEEWAGQFKASFLIVSMMDSLSQQGTKHCSVCKKTQPLTLYWCSECQALFCDQCLVMHNKMPYSMNHEVTAHQEGQQVQKPLICKEHDEKIKLFCRDCRKCLCTVCCSINHRRCKVVVTMKEMLPVVKKDVSGHLENVRKSVDNEKREQENTRKKIEQINVKKIQVKTEIKDAFADLRTFMDQKEKVLIEAVDNKLKARTEYLETEKEGRDIHIECLEHNSESTQNALELEDAIQLFDIYQSMDIRPSFLTLQQVKEQQQSHLTSYTSEANVASPYAYIPGTQGESSFQYMPATQGESSFQYIPATQGSFQYLQANQGVAPSAYIPTFPGGSLYAKIPPTQVASPIAYIPSHHKIQEEISPSHYEHLEANIPSPFIQSQPTIPSYAGPEISFLCNIFQIKAEFDKMEIRVTGQNFESSVSKPGPSHNSRSVVIEPSHHTQSYVKGPSRFK